MPYDHPTSNSAAGEIESPLEVTSSPNQPQLQADETLTCEAAPTRLQFSRGDTTVSTATPTRRRRGPSLSRRIGQAGCVFQRTKTWSPSAPSYGKFWIDIPGGNRKQKTISLGVCATRTIARQRLRDYIDQAEVNSKEQFHQNTSPAITFKQQSERWLEHSATRTRKPVKPATLAGWQHALNAWLLPNIGGKLLSEVSNRVLRELVGKMTAAGLAPKTIVNYVQVVKMVVASAVNDEGDQIYPRTWNHDFIGLPIVNKEKQHRPTITERELGEIVSSVKERYAVLFTLLAGTGLRIGEALGLKTSDLSSNCRILHVRRSIWRGKEQAPKTPNAIRVVDVPETLARVLLEYSSGRTGYLFATATGRPLLARNVLRVLHGTGKRIGFHAFRRYRAAVLRKAQAPEDLITLWLGHARTLADRYATQLREDELYRGEWCERAGLGFSVVPLFHKEVVSIGAARVA
jgi:integrase